MVRQIDRTIPKTTTSIKVNPEVWKEAKIEAIRHDMSTANLLEDAILEWIEKREKGKKK